MSSTPVSSRDIDAAPRPVLLTDAAHVPKTHGSVGILIVGVGGAPGCTVLAGVLAERRSATWRGPWGELVERDRLLGCLTQSPSELRSSIRGLADAGMAAVGGWDVRPTRLGDALAERHRTLDHDLVRQVREEMNGVRVFKGYYDPEYDDKAELRRAEATHVVTSSSLSSSSSSDHHRLHRETPLRAAEVLRTLRADVRYFKWRNGVVGHTTVIWLANGERETMDLPADADTAVGLLRCVENDAVSLPPSILYATAAVLEGCSFICGAAGGAANTSHCAGLAELATKRGVYQLGSDFRRRSRASACVRDDLFRATGLRPLNGDDDDGVEHRAVGFLGSVRTVVAYERASSDAASIAPSVVDAAVWCDWLVGRDRPADEAAAALAYLFETSDSVVDPGPPSRRLAALKRIAKAASRAADKTIHGDSSSSHNHHHKKQVRIRSTTDRQYRRDVEWSVPDDAAVVCAGLACVDMQLHHATRNTGGSEETIESFRGETSVAGGSVSMACRTLSRLCHGAPPPLVSDSHHRERYMEITPPVVHSVIPLCRVGDDATGARLVDLLEERGAACRNVDARSLRASRNRAPAGLRTALAVLPIYRDGARGCLFDAAGNADFGVEDMEEMIRDVEERRRDADPPVRAFVFGYPHLLPRLRGAALARVYDKARSLMADGGVTVMDLNGVPAPPPRASPPSPSRSVLTAWSTTDDELEPPGLKTVAEMQSDPVVGEALPKVDLLHLNEEELCFLTGCVLSGEDEERDLAAVDAACSLFLMCGVAVVAVTRGRKGCHVKTNGEWRFARSPSLPASWVNRTATVPAATLPQGTALNTNGAGDSFTAGLLLAALLRRTGRRRPSFVWSHDDPITAIAAPRRDDDDGGDDDRPPAPPPTSPARSTTSASVSSASSTLTPYTLYMREKYVGLRAQCDGDRKAVFARCHQMWENESEEVRAMYARRCEEEREEEQKHRAAAAGTEPTGSPRRQGTPPRRRPRETDDETVAETHGHDRRRDHDESDSKSDSSDTLDLESAARFAGLVASRHIDVSARDAVHVDVTELLRRAMAPNRGARAET